jgi:NADH dehydrogenase
VILPSDGIVITGANGQLGRALLARLSETSHPQVRALVRSERAKKTIEAENFDSVPEIQIVDYTRPGPMEEALAGAKSVIHLVGIIKEMPGASYVEAHEQTCHALALAASRAGIERIVYLSILGSKTDSKNPCLASKGRAEATLLDDRVAATVIRVPMVIGGNDAASRALQKQARSSSVRLIGGGRTRQQPIDARDVVRAVLAACEAEPGRDLSLDAGGPDCLSHRNLVLRAATFWNNEPKLGSIPTGLARFGVGLLERILPNPPITRAMFDILQHDDQVDTAVFCQKLGIELTPLDTTLSDFIGPESESHP